MDQNSSFSEEQYFEELVQRGITDLKGGQRDLARRWLTKASAIKSTDARPWLWLSATTDDPAEQRLYLERAVAAEPGNAAARRGLMMLSEKLDKTRLMKEGEGLAPRQPAVPEEAQAQVFRCPNCGGSINFVVERQEILCQNCGYVRPVEKKAAADTAETAVDFVLPTTRAHRWAEAQQRLACEQCGAITMLLPGQRADHCPYCGSNRMSSSVEILELIDPQVIGLIKLNEQQALEKLKHWLRKGLFSPDDLALKAGGLHLQPAYYPFWTFDGTIEVPWRCEINVGSGKNPRWVARNGTACEFFDDVLVAGVKAMKPGDVAGIEPFNLKELVAFAPEYLAGWPALTYDYPLADASLKAREKVIKKIRLGLSDTIEPTHEKRNVDTGAGQWSGLTFKHVLLPLWVGAYHFQGRAYRVLINGQTGKVGGQKPLDHVKIALVAVLGIVVLFALVYLVYMLLGR